VPRAHGIALAIARRSRDINSSPLSRGLARCAAISCRASCSRALAHDIAAFALIGRRHRLACASLSTPQLSFISKEDSSRVSSRAVPPRGANIARLLSFLLLLPSIDAHGKLRAPRLFSRRRSRRTHSPLTLISEGSLSRARVALAGSTDLFALLTLGHRHLLSSTFPLLLSYLISTWIRVMASSSSCWHSCPLSSSNWRINMCHHTFTFMRHLGTRTVHTYCSPHKQLTQRRPAHLWTCSCLDSLLPRLLLPLHLP